MTGECRYQRQTRKDFQGLTRTPDETRQKYQHNQYQADLNQEADGRDCNHRSRQPAQPLHCCVPLRQARANGELSQSSTRTMNAKPSFPTV